LISVTLGYYSYRLSSKSIQNEISTVTLRDTKQVSRGISSLQKDVNDLSTFICLDPNVQKFIRSEDLTGQNSIYKEGQSASVSLESLARLLASKDYISYIGIYGKNGSKYYLSSDGSTGMSNYDLVKLGDIYKKASALKGEPLWVALNDKNQIFIPTNKAPKIAMCRSLLNTNTFEESGFLIICINISTIQRTYLDDLTSKDRNIILLDNKNEIVAYNTTDNFSEIETYIPQILTFLTKYEDNPTIELDKKKILLTYSTIDQTSWKAVYLVAVSDLLLGIRSIFSMTLLLILGCLIVAMIISLYISSILTSPIKKLLSSMKRVKEGYFKEKVDFKFMDEIGMLGLEYNDMIDNLHDLIDKVYKLQIREKEAELKALQAQINPHFLYNTLDTIYWKSQKSQDKDIGEMIYALSRLFRLTLNRGNEFTLVKNEKEFIEYYLLLQKRRFRHKLEYKICIDDNILNYSMPKLILQPFVENSIIHGTERDNEKSTVVVYGYLVEDRIIFIIQDDGEGMEESIIKLLLNSKASVKISGRQKGYAIGNVNERLSLYYNGNYRLNIFSEIGKGTKVEIIIPAKIQDND
jgi:two-component system sensor histidine kinase YesM